MPFLLLSLGLRCFTWQSFDRRIPAILVKGPSYSNLISSPLITSAMILFPNKVIFWGAGGGAWICLSGYMIQPIIRQSSYYLPWVEWLWGTYSSLPSEIPKWVGPRWHHRDLLHHPAPSFLGSLYPPVVLPSGDLSGVSWEHLSHKLFILKFLSQDLLLGDLDLRNHPKLRQAS